MGGFSLKIRELLFSSVLLLCIFSRVALALSPDGQALVNFRISVLGSDGVIKQWRPEDSDPCGWKGVLCDPKSKRVISLILPDHKLSGSISPDIGKLDQLQFLALHDNNFYGTIPPALGNCTKLKSLFLQGNYLSGWIPDELGNLPELEHLDLSSNSLSGNIPPSLGKLNNLVSFNVSTNFLVGQIPTDGHLANFGNDSFLGNRNLCGQQISQDCKAGGSSFSRSPVAGQVAKVEGLVT